NWGPWLPSEAGTGMVSPATQRAFEAKGVRLIDPQQGLALFRQELFAAPAGDVEIIAGEGPWEQREALRDALPDDSPPSAPTPAPTIVGVSPWPLMVRARRDTTVKRGSAFRRPLDSQWDLFLDAQGAGGATPLSAGVSLELMAEAAAVLWPDWQVAEVTDFHLPADRGRAGGRADEIEIAVLGSEHGGEGGLKAAVELRCAASPATVFARAIIHLCDRLSPAALIARGPGVNAAPLSAQDASRVRRFYGDALPRVTEVLSLDERAIVAAVPPSQPAELVRGAAPAATWLFDPGLIDCGLQLPVLWTNLMRGRATTVKRVGAMRRFDSGGRPVRRAHFVVDGDASAAVHGRLIFVDADDRGCLIIEDIECAEGLRLTRLCERPGKTLAG
ncbi:MAG: polyketide synthase dehydratase domain-containing protein, partial [Rhodospirillales bacterium]|nr:polyketide synthase dehydratase domain-containing protein [Rhodospirillales bacterium]